MKRLALNGFGPLSFLNKAQLAMVLLCVAFFFLLGTQTALAATADDFVTTWQTDNPGTSNNTSITVPMIGGPYDVDWDNDETFDETGLTGAVTHDFLVSGTYTIRIRGTYDSIAFVNGGDKDKILSLDQWGTNSWTSMNSAFAGAINLQVPATDTPDFSAVTDMSGMFDGAVSANPDASGWDVSALADASNMFAGVTLSVSNYEALLTGWNAQVLQSGVNFSGGNSTYCYTTATAARDEMVASDSWVITDGGRVCPDLSSNELRNIATRAEARTGLEVLIGGFVIVGNTPKCVVVQGLGGSVAVPVGETRLADPVLTLKSGLTTIAENDNWQDQANPTDLPAIVNAGRAPNDILEAAIYKCLDPGAYTALVTGFGGSTGVGMVAIYDADDGDSYLRNIAARSWVGSGNLISIGGFVITGDAPKQILIRGLGPSMAKAFPLDSPLLMDPQLRLYQGATLIESNDDWGDAANAAEIGALPAPLPPTDSREPAILMTLEPGLYSAHLLGTDATTGIGNVAVYDLTGRGTILIKNFSASQNEVALGASTNLSWTTENATSCVPSGGTGGWDTSEIELPNGSTAITIENAGTYEFKLTCEDAQGGLTERSLLVTASPCGDYVSPLEGYTTAWFGFFAEAFPYPGYAEELAYIGRDEYMAIEFNTGDVLDSGSLMTIETTITSGSRVGAVSQCPGEFDVAPECKEKWGTGGSILWSTENYPGACQLEPHTKYYFNVTFTDGFDPDSSTCGDRKCVTKVNIFNPDPR